MSNNLGYTGLSKNYRDPSLCIIKKCIGVFDSGFGGLDVLRGIVKELGDYDYIYLGDNARVPYGPRSQKTIYKFTEQAVNFLFKNQCELIIFACNTISSEALRKIQQKYLPKQYPNKRVLGILIPAVEEAVKKTNNKKVGIMATRGTVLSGAFIREFVKIDPRVKVWQKACPLLVPIVEAGEQNLRAVNIILESYLQPLLNKEIDTLILGCTHYGILEDKIKQIAGTNIKIVSGAKIIPEKLKNYLARHPEIDEKLGKNKVIHFYSTGLTKKFTILGSKFFGKVINTHKISLK